MDQKLKNCKVKKRSFMYHNLYTLQNMKIYARENCIVATTCRKKFSHLLKDQSGLTKNVWPRHFVLSKDGSCLYVAEQQLNKIQKWNISDGNLTLIKEAKSDNNPAVILEL